MFAGRTEFLAGTAAERLGSRVSVCRLCWLGIVPLAHSPCTLIKVNGEYLDTRLRNTDGQLRKYDAPLNRVLDQVFDECGLIL